MFVPRNCLAETLDRLTTRGGYFVARLSGLWPQWGVHVMWQDPDGTLHSYIDPDKDGSKYRALWGYQGEWRIGDDAPCPPVPAHVIVANFWIAALGATWWAVARVFRGRA